MVARGLPYGLRLGVVLGRLHCAAQGEGEWCEQASCCETSHSECRSSRARDPAVMYSPRRLDGAEEGERDVRDTHSADGGAAHVQDRVVIEHEHADEEVDLWHMLGEF